jgi:hypothetical protein
LILPNLKSTPSNRQFAIIALLVCPVRGPDECGDRDNEAGNRRAKNYNRCIRIHKYCSAFPASYLFIIPPLPVACVAGKSFLNRPPIPVPIPDPTGIGCYLPIRNQGRFTCCISHSNHRLERKIRYNAPESPTLLIRVYSRFINYY